MKIKKLMTVENLNKARHILDSKGIDLKIVISSNKFKNSEDIVKWLKENDFEGDDFSLLVSYIYVYNKTSKLTRRPEHYLKTRGRRFESKPLKTVGAMGLKKGARKSTGYLFSS